MLVKKILLFLVLFFLCLSLHNKCFSLDSSSKNYVEGEILIKFKSGLDEDLKQQFCASSNMKVKEKGYSKSTSNVETMKLPAGMSVQEAINIYKNNPNVEYVEPNYIYHVCRTPNDSYFGELWGLNNTGQEVPESDYGGGATGTEDADIDAPEAWGLNTGSSDIVVAIIDTGVVLTASKNAHEDLENNLWVNTEEVDNNNVDDDGNGYIDDYYGYDFVDTNGKPQDECDGSKSGHGTHVAGIIGAEGNNGIGVVGVSWDVSLMILRALDTDGDGNTVDIRDAIIYAKDMGADIINCSFTGDASDLIGDEIEAAKNSVLFVCAAGNNGDGEQSNGWNIDIEGQKQYPAAYTFDNIIAVAATDQDDELTDYSNYGTTSVDVAAPGGDDVTNDEGESVPNLLSTYNLANNICPNTLAYGYWAGTSMATPYVSGLAALMLSRKSSLSVSDLKSKIINGVDVKDSLVDKISSGGRINAYNSLSSVSSGDSSSSSESSTGAHEICFIATVVYNGADTWQVKKLCKFRDNFLMTNCIGRKFVSLYYEIGPVIAEFISNHTILKSGMKWMLDGFLYFYKKAEAFQNRKIVKE